MTHQENKSKYGDLNKYQNIKKSPNSNFQEVVSELTNSVYNLQTLRRDISGCKDKIFGYDSEVAPLNEPSNGSGLINCLKDLNNLLSYELNKCFEDIDMIKEALKQDNNEDIGDTI